MTDVIVIGGGPAGATAANILARAGVKVLVIERDTFPRFRVGESLLPSALPVLERLGVDLGSGPHQLKQGAEFYDESTGQYELYEFADALPGGPRHAFQVERAVFDAELLGAATRSGADVHQGETVVGVSVADDGVEVETDLARYRGRYLIDASGSDLFLGRRQRSIAPFRTFGRGSAFAHYDHVDEAVLAELSPQGNVKVLRVPHGWTWVIPLHGGKLSIGTVVSEGTVELGLMDRVADGSPMLTRFIAGTRRTRPSLVGDFSYCNTRSRGPRTVSVGDAACFLDPVFSSGVALALESGARAADMLVPALGEGREHDAELMAPLDRHMGTAYRAFFILIHRFYHTAILDNLFFADEPDRELRRGLITLLAGDVWREDNAFQNLVMAAERNAVPAGLWPE